MRILRVGIGLILVMFCICLPAATQEQEMTVRGKLVRVVAIGGESTGWAVELESEITMDGKRANSVEIDYHETKKLERLENKRVKATGKLVHRHGVETGDRSILDVSSIKETKAK